ncbi:hypothetical protein KM295_13195 [Natronomonas sp. F2-12]|uniref:Uncharacterized protein n=1 Tax=Natronomonas aquatica TaxID=2841590 RepID=A0A9R1CV92_9EURY|nr:hypothetical protein [Natronomonas aquatica]MCQ4334413.1 hypothetical protein [Natronomonas aquatica]
MREILTHCFRGYAAIGAVAAGFTALWAIGVIDVTMPLVGYAWFIVAAAGTVVAVGLITKQEEVFELDTTPEQLETFEESTLTGRPFDMYIGALAAWAAVSFGWVLGGMSAAGLTVVGYGWFAIAAYGLLIGIGIALNHREDIVTAVNPADSLEKR